MPITVQSVIDEVASALDAEGSDRYLFDQDYKPAINYSIEWIVSVFNAAFGEKKISPEALRELIKTSVWKANKYSRVALKTQDIGDFWTIVGVYPEPMIHPDRSTNAFADQTQSLFCPEKSFIKSDYSASRLSAEQWNVNTRNPFKAGNSVIQQKDLVSYGYRDFSDYSSTTYADKGEIEIRPSIALDFVAIEFLKIPSSVSLQTDNIQFPAQLRSLVVQKVLNFISFKQGDSTNLYGISDRDIKNLIGLMS